MVICNHVDENECSDKCPHKVPHVHIYDIYSYGDDGIPEGKFCDEIESECG